MFCWYRRYLAVITNRQRIKVKISICVCVCVCVCVRVCVFFTRQLCSWVSFICLFGCYSGALLLFLIEFAFFRIRCLSVGCFCCRVRALFLILSNTHKHTHNLYTTCLPASPHSQFDFIWIYFVVIFRFTKVGLEFVGKKTSRLEFGEAADVMVVVEAPLEPEIDSGNRSNLAIACEKSYSPTLSV